VDWLHVAQDRDRWQVRVHNAGIWRAERRSASQKISASCTYNYSSVPNIDLFMFLSPYCTNTAIHSTNNLISLDNPRISSVLRDHQRIFLYTTWHATLH
jgi:hypothetical protein